VVAANLLSGPLKRGRLQLRDLAAVQRRRLIPTRLIQAFQVLLQKRIGQAATDRARPFRLPWFFRVPFLRSLPPRVMLLGILRPRLSNDLLALTPPGAADPLENLVEGISSDNRHPETDWGEPVGEEAR
jgi:hypothetical protein